MIATFIFFYSSSFIYLILTIIYAYLSWIYWFGYYQKKRSKIIYSISMLFFWHGIQMAALMFMALLTYYSQHEAKYPFYAVAFLSGIMELKYAFDFAYWSMNYEELPIEK